MTETLSKLLTAEELEELPLDDTKCELVKGVLELRERPTQRHGYTAGRLSYLIWRYLDTNPVGTLYGEVGYTLERGPDTVRCPDLSFIADERHKPAPRRGYQEMAPDLAIEILSPSNRPPEMAGKIEEYFRNGARLIWLVDPLKRTVQVFAVDSKPYALGSRDILDGGDVLPGFRAPIGGLFEYGGDGL